MNEQKLIEYFNNDDLAVSVWKSKYQLKNNEGIPQEETPDDMHRRLAKEFARVEFENIAKDSGRTNALSEFGKNKQWQLSQSSLAQIEEEVFSYFKDFKYIIPQGSIMQILGNTYKTGSLSNCFVVPSPYDSYGGICKTDEQMAQLMKRRGGVGTNLNTLRPSKTIVNNAAGTSTGAASFMERYSNTTREVAQDGRRGALMLLLDVRHPDIFKFVTAKKDRTKVTGANISVMLTDAFMNAAKNDTDFLCKFPIDLQLKTEWIPESMSYNKLIEINNNSGTWIMKIKAKELFDLIIEMAWENAEPGLAFIDQVNNYSPDGVYHIINKSNPCGEQWLPDYDSCRLIALNLFSVVDNPFTKEAKLNLNKLYEISYMQQRFADDIVDLEIEYVKRIIVKIQNDPEPEEVKRTEIELWNNVLHVAKTGRRTGCGITALGDMLAALNLKYDSDASLEVIDTVFKTKIRAELDCTIDLSILRGSFEGWNPDKEFGSKSSYQHTGCWYAQNDFYQNLLEEFPEQTYKMIEYGRRNISWSTVAPTGSLSILAKAISSPNLTSGMEPVFAPYYMRRKKINPNDNDVRVDFTDQNGDKWQEFPVLMGAFKDWLTIRYTEEFPPFNGPYPTFEEHFTKERVKHEFENSPWYGSTANDINWEKRVQIQAIIQKYTTNAISSTINLPKTATKEEVATIYWKAWELGLKGITIYVDECRSGVLISNDAKKEATFSQKDAIKRPLALDCDVHSVKVKGIEYTIAVSILEEHPYEVFVMPNITTTCKKGCVVRVKKGNYNLVDEGGQLCIENISARVNEEEAAIARLISTSLRHGTAVEHLVNQLNKTHGSLVSYSKAISRVLSKYVEAKETGEKCPDCGGKLRKEEGCTKCADNCGYSRC